MNGAMRELLPDFSNAITQCSKIKKIVQFEYEYIVTPLTQKLTDIPPENSGKTE